MTNRMRPKAVIRYNSGNDGRDGRYEIEFSCPNCGQKLKSYAEKNACDKCGVFFDWGHQKPRIEVVRTVVWN